MTRRTNARLAGSMFLLYIATGIADMILTGRATGGAEGVAAKLASMAQHAPLVRLGVLLGLLQAVYAVVLGVTLWALTRDEDADLAMLGLSFRVGEGVINAVSTGRTLQLLSIATAGVAATATDQAAANAAGALLMKVGGGGASSFCFGVGSLCFSYLFLRARSIPTALAWVGVVASVLWVVGLPLQTVGFLSGPVTYALWAPMAVFEVWLALWLIFKGVAPPEARRG